MLGWRIRLMSSFIVPTNWTKQAKAVAYALKKYVRVVFVVLCFFGFPLFDCRYGGLVSDSNVFYPRFSIDITPDPRWPPGCFDDLNSIPVTAFEVPFCASLLYLWTPLFKVFSFVRVVDYGCIVC